ncbi:MAG: hypothetical protein WCS94_11940, partial [Verrucomicrobiota bacterium]
RRWQKSRFNRAYQNFLDRVYARLNPETETSEDDPFVAWDDRLRQRLLSWQMAVGIMVLIPVIFLGYVYGFPLYQSHQGQRWVQQAEAQLARGNFEQAELCAKAALKVNSGNPMAIRVMADVADHTGSSNSLAWRQLELKLIPGVTNQFALVNSALQVEPPPFPTATRTLAEIPPAYQPTATYQRLAGTLALKLGQNQKAERFFTELIRLEPTNSLNRLSLAMIQIASTDQPVRQSARSTLEALASDPLVGLQAIRPLAAESFERHDWVRAEYFSRQVTTNAQATFSDQIFHLTILHASQSPDFTATLKQLEHAAETNAFNADALAEWLNGSGHAQQALDWLAGLPTKFTLTGELPITRANSYIALEKWRELERYLKTPWLGYEPIRYALLARAEEKQFKSIDEVIAWKRALGLTLTSPQLLPRLADLTMAWGWDTRNEAVLWVAVNKCADPIWAVNALNQLCISKHDQEGLWRLAKIAYQRNPKDNQAGNNYAWYSLLLNLDVPQARKIAQAAYTNNRTNAVYAKTYALSLFKQDRYREAVLVFQKLSREQLDTPANSVYYGIMLAAAGDIEAAKPFLKRSSQAWLLPEEESLVAHAQSGE